jgi:hypothetical protein
MSKTNYLIQNEDHYGDEEDVSIVDLDYRSSDRGYELADDDRSGGVVISKTKLAMIGSLLDTIKESHEKITQLISGALDLSQEARVSIGQSGMSAVGDASYESDGGRIIEGVFDGENMIGPDGKQYSIPANYASKSKLVEGDILKLTITPKGTFVYKQIGPIDRSRVIGELHQTDTGAFVVRSLNKEWKVLTASVTYYKGRDGDEIVILIPKVGESRWAAVENIVRKTL